MWKELTHIVTFSLGFIGSASRIYMLPTFQYSTETAQNAGTHLKSPLCLSCSLNIVPCYGLTNLNHQFSSVQFTSVTQSCPNLCDPVNCSTPGLPVHHQLPEFTQTHIHRVGDAIQPSHPLSSPSPPAPILPSIRVFSNESTLCMRWPKYWSFSFSIIPSKEHPGRDC